MNALIFPGQGAQFVGMGKDLYELNSEARQTFKKAESILSYKITEIMFNGSMQELERTEVLQPAIFLYSVIAAHTLKYTPDKVAGHSMGEFSALVAGGFLSFEEALVLVWERAKAMQRACDLNPSTMVAVAGLGLQTVEEICNNIEDTVVPANYNCHDQIVISGTHLGIDKAAKELGKRGAKVVPLPVNGAFHSPLMEPAKRDLEKVIDQTQFNPGSCPIYQNVSALPTQNVSLIKKNLISQLTSPVRWDETIQNMIGDGVTSFFECGPGNVLDRFVRKICERTIMANI